MPCDTAFGLWTLYPSGRKWKWRILSKIFSDDKRSLPLRVTDYSTENFAFRERVEDIKQLSSPFFPLEVVRDFAMHALEEAVRLNQVHNRDPIGGSNENLFV